MVQGRRSAINNAVQCFFAGGKRSCSRSKGSLVHREQSFGSKYVRPLNGISNPRSTKPTCLDAYTKNGGQSAPKSALCRSIIEFESGSGNRRVRDEAISAFSSPKDFTNLGYYFCLLNRAESTRIPAPDAQSHSISTISQI